MLKNDTSKKLMIRFKKSKDFNKTIEKLEKEGYFVEKRQLKNKKAITVSKDKDTIWNIYVLYEENEDLNAEYKQRIYAIYY